MENKKLTVKELKLELANMGIKGLTKMKKSQLEEAQRSAISSSLEQSSSPTKKEKATKAKRAPSAYNLFVKENIGRYSTLRPTERMRAVSELWRASK